MNRRDRRVSTARLLASIDLHAAKCPADRVAARVYSRRNSNTFPLDLSAGFTVLRF